MSQLTRLQNTAEVLRDLGTRCRESDLMVAAHNIELMIQDLCRLDESSPHNPMNEIWESQSGWLADDPASSECGYQIWCDGFRAAVAYLVSAA